MKRKKLSAMLVLTMVMTESLMGTVHAEEKTVSYSMAYEKPADETQVSSSEQETASADKETEQPETKPPETKPTETVPPETGVTETETEQLETGDTETETEHPTETTPTETETEYPETGATETEHPETGETEQPETGDTETEHPGTGGAESETEYPETAATETETSVAESDGTQTDQEASETEATATEQPETEKKETEKKETEKKETEKKETEKTETSAQEPDLSLFINVNAYPEVDTSEAVQEIYQYLREKNGLNHAAACGVLANIHLESNFDPTAVGDGGTSLGLCQWHLERCSSLMSYCAANELDYCTIEGQMEYLQHELESFYPHVLNYLLEVEDTAEGAYDAAQFWCLKFEMPSSAALRAIQRGNLAKTEYYPESFEWTKEAETRQDMPVVFKQSWGTTIEQTGE